MTETAAWTIGRLLQWTTDYLREHGADNPRLDAEVLLAHARNCPRIALYTAFDALADDDLRTEFRMLVKRRAEGTPVAYLVGYREFYSLRFHVTPDVLIPRPETEFVLITLLDLIKEAGPTDRPLRVADVGTGSGNLAVAIAIHVPQAQVTALDVSPAALQVAQKNAQDHGVAERIAFVESDLFTMLPEDDRFDCIVSNPPYIGRREIDELPRDVVQHEPHVALFAGEFGLDVLTRLIAEAEHRLQPGGWLVSEISPLLRDNVLEAVTAHADLHRASIVDDLARLPRVLRVQRRD